MSYYDGINKAILVGNVVADANLEFTNKSVPYAKFSVATNKGFKKDDVWTSEVEFHNLVVWRNAEKIYEKLLKGTKVYVEGRLKTQSWEHEGIKRSKTEIVVEDIRILADGAPRDPIAENVDTNDEITSDDLPF